MSSARRVAIYRSSLLPASETFVLAQARALRRWEPLLFGHARATPSLSLDNLASTVLCDPSTRRGRVLKRVDGWLERALGCSPVTTHMLVRARANLVHAHFGSDGVRVWPAVRAAGLPLIVTLHGFDVTIDEHVWRAHPGRRERAYPDRLRALAAAPGVQFVAVSEAIRAQAIARGIPPAKLARAYIGVDLARFRPRGLPAGKRPRRVLFVGRLVEKKGVSYLLSAFARVIARHTDAELVIAGDGPLRAALVTQAQRAALPVRFLGSVDEPTVARELAQARVFCLPSVTAASGDAEGLGIALLEAQAAGVPVVTSALGGRDEAIVHGETGYAFAERDVAALAAHLLSLLGDDGRATRFGARGRAFVCRQFDLARCTEQLELLYDRALYSVRSRAASPDTRAADVPLVGQDHAAQDGASHTH